MRPVWVGTVQLDDLSSTLHFWAPLVSRWEYELLRGLPLAAG